MTMKFTVNKASLLKALVLTGKGISQKVVIPILENYLFKIENDTVTITGGSEGFFVSTAIEITGGNFIKAIAIPSAKLLNIIKSLPDQPIGFQIKEKDENGEKRFSIKIKTATGDYNMPAYDGDHYIQMPVSELVSFEAELQPLLSSINKTLFACSNDTLRPALTGVHIKFSNKQALLVGCNGGMLSIASMPVEFESEQTFVVPPRVLSALQEIATGEKVKITFGDNYIHFITDNGIDLKSLLIGENYVAYESVIPASHNKTAIVNILELIGAIKRVSLFAELGLDVIKMSFDGSKCTLSARNDMGEHASEEVSVQFEGDPIAIGISGKQFTNCMSKFNNQELNILLTDPLRAIVMVEDPASVSLKKDLILVMPFKLSF